jgi:hydroxymethylbilane synthase
MKKIVVGVRGSKLSLTQSKGVLNEIKKKNPDFDYEIKIIKTSGDFDKKTAIEKVQNKDFFTDNIQKALLGKEIDMAIHSMKDLSSEMPEALMLTKVPKRQDPRDVLVLNGNYETLKDLPSHLKIGTSSHKRGALINEPLLEPIVLPIRGNVDERTKLVKDNIFDGTVLAAAGLHRLNMSEIIDFYLNPKKFIPAPAQGTLAIQIRKEDSDLLESVNKIAHRESNIQNKVERAFYELSEIQYKIIGGYCEIKDESIELYGMLGDQEQYIKSSKKGEIGKEKKLAEDLFEEMSEALNNDK